MAKSRNFVNEESTRQSESPAHKNRRAEAQRLREASMYYDDQSEDDPDEYATFEPIPKRPKKVVTKR